MELIGSLFLILALLLLVLLFITQPFLHRRSRVSIDASNAQQKSEHERSSLLAERDRVLTALQELDFDNALGKVPEDEFPLQRAELLKTGADVLRRLDSLQPQISLAGSQEVSIEDRIESAVAARRADAVQDAGEEQPQPVASVALKTDANGKRQADPLEDVIANRKRERKESAAGFCPGCGRPVSKSDKFCSKCGAVL